MVFHKVNAEITTAEAPDDTVLVRQTVILIVRHQGVLMAIREAERSAKPVYSLPMRMQK